MAEYVQLNLEFMLPELEIIEKIQLFTKDEVRRITKKRKEFEYKLQRGTKFKEDLLNYIRHEWNLLFVIKNKNVADKSMASKKNGIAHSVSQHIQKLFTEALRRFGSDVKVWMSYIDFCIQLHLYPALSLSLEKMLELHQDKPELFCTAAQTEFNINGSMDRARMFFLNGIRLHKESELLYREAFAMELTFVANARAKYGPKDKEVPEDDPLLQGRLAELIYESSLMSIRSINLVSDLLTISKKHPFAKKLSERIYNDIYEKFRDNERRWDIAARHTLENPPPQSSAKDAVKQCVAVYEEAVKHLNTQEMWSYYVEAMLDLNEDLTYLKIFKTNCLMQALLGAHCADKLKEEYYLKWASKLEGEDDQEKRRDVLKSGASKYPKSVKLWEQYLMTLTLMKVNWDTLMKAFSTALTELKAKKTCSLPLWKFLISYTLLTDPGRAEELMKKGVREGGEVSITVKTMYLEWLVLSRGLKAGRKLYSEYAELPPFSATFHKKMIELESYNGTIDVHKVRKCYRNLVNQFGKENAEVWMDFIKFEKKEGDPKNVSELYSSAKRTLKSSQAETFVSLYSLHLVDLEADRPINDEPPKKTPKIVVDDSSNE